MPAPSTFFFYGGTAPLLEEFEATDKLHGLDTAKAVYIASASDAIRSGQMLPAPYASMKVQEVQRRKVGSQWRLSCDAIGLIDAKASSILPGYPKRSFSAEDWDRVQVQWLSPVKGQFSPGSGGAYGGTFFCETSSDSEVFPGLGWYINEGSFIGLASSKPITTSVSVGGLIVSSDSMVVNLSPNGWTTPRKSSVELPEVVVSQRTLLSSPPPTAMLPGNGTPIGAPPVRVLTIGGTDLIHQWPSGWTVNGIDSKQIIGKPLYDTTIRYKYKHQRIPG